jgi:hypothetical protein
MSKSWPRDSNHNASGKPGAVHPAPQRKIALAEIAMNSGFDGMELATTVTISDPDPEVVVAVIESLASMLTGASQSPRRQRSFGVGGPRGGNNGSG